MGGVQLGAEAARLDGADQIGLGDFSVEKHLMGRGSRRAVRGVRS